MGQEASGNKSLSNSSNNKRNNGEKHSNNYYNNANKTKTPSTNKNYVNIRRND